MRLRRLWLGNYYNLKDFTLRFDDTNSLYGSTSLRFFVGLNGSGKSKALEAIGLIFSHLYISRSPGIEFDIEYELDAKIVCITTRLQTVMNRSVNLSHLGDNRNQPPRTRTEAAKINRIGAWVLSREVEEDEWLLHDRWPTVDNPYLPGYVAGYSTGPTTGFPWVLSESVERLIQTEISNLRNEQRPSHMTARQWESERLIQLQELELWKDRYRDDARTLSFEADDALYAVLALLVHEGMDGKVRADYLERRSHVLRRVGLDEMQPLLAFTLVVPGDWRSRLTPGRRNQLTKLLHLVTVQMPLKLDATDERETSVAADRSDPAGQPAPSFYAVFDLDDAFRTEAIASLFATPLDFFKELLAWRRQGGVNGIRLVLKRTGVDPLLPDYAFSDGEYLYVGRYALLLMLRNVPECLVMLDEPETHFNDRWKLELVYDMKTLLDDMPKGESRSRYLSEVLIATHSDLTLVDADPRQVYLFKDGIRRPPILTFGADRDEITRALFAPEGEVLSYSEDYIGQAIRDDDRARMNELMEITGPGFDRFLLRRKLADPQSERKEGGQSAPPRE